MIGFDEIWHCPGIHFAVRKRVSSNYLIIFFLFDCVQASLYFRDSDLFIQIFSKSIFVYFCKSYRHKKNKNFSVRQRFYSTRLIRLIKGPLLVVIGKHHSTSLNTMGWLYRLHVQSDSSWGNYTEMDSLWTRGSDRVLIAVDIHVQIVWMNILYLLPCQ